MINLFIKEELKPCWKWTGGKTRLLPILEKYIDKALYSNRNLKTYVEPFVGGGALFWRVLSKYTNNFDKFIISDNNAELINSYFVIKNNPKQLIEKLSLLSTNYLSLDDNQRKQMYYNCRNEYNNIIMRHIAYDGNSELSITCAALFLFLNKTCFNGLYRTARDGHFNTAAGRYKNPCICNEILIKKASQALTQYNVLIKLASYTDIITNYCDNQTFIYLDPPYRPLTKTSSFTNYTKDGFNDDDQQRLASLCNIINDKGTKFMLSNSDPHNIDLNDNFFDDLYKNYYIKRVSVGRNISGKVSSRKTVTEILVTNF